MVTEPIVRAMLMDVFDPEMGVSIVDLGLVYKIDISDAKIDIDLTLTNPGCPKIDELTSEIKKVLLGLSGINEVNVNLVWSPPWKPEMMTDEAREILSEYYPSFGINMQ